MDPIEIQLRLRRYRQAEHHLVATPSPNEDHVVAFVTTRNDLDSALEEATSEILLAQADEAVAEKKAGGK